MSLTIMVVCRQAGAEYGRDDPLGRARWHPARAQAQPAARLRTPQPRPPLVMREDWALERWNVFGSVAEGFAWLLVAGPGAPLDARE